VSPAADPVGSQGGGQRSQSLGNVRISGRAVAGHHDWWRWEHGPSARGEQPGRPQPRDWRCRQFAPRVRVLNGGLQVKLWRGSNAVEAGGERGEVSGMSLASRRRFRLCLMAIDWGQYSSFWVSLTYHKVWGVTCQGWKRDLFAFRKRLCRAWGPRGLEFFTWRLERQRRGAPHYHLIVAFRGGCGVSAGAFRRWCEWAWLEITGGWGTDWAAEAYGVRCDRVVSVDRHDRPQLGGILAYLVSEHCKVDQDKWDGEHTGRVWGISGWPSYVQERVVELDAAGLARVVQRLNARGAEVGSWYLKNLTDRWPGFYVLGDGPALFDELLDGVAHRLVAQSG